MMFEIDHGGDRISLPLSHRVVLGIIIMTPRCWLISRESLGREQEEMREDEMMVCGSEEGGVVGTGKED